MCRCDARESFIATVGQIAESPAKWASTTTDASWIATFACVAAAVLVYVAGSFLLTAMLGIKRPLEALLLIPIAAAAAFYMVRYPGRLVEPLTLLVIARLATEAIVRTRPIYVIDDLSALFALVVIRSAPERSFKFSVRLIVVIAGVLAIMALVQWVLLFSLPELNDYILNVDEKGEVHSSVRHPIALLGLTDDYVHDGRVVAEFMHDEALPAGIRNSRENFVELALGRASLVWSNRAVTAVDKVYARYLSRIADITEDRDELAAQIVTVLNNAAFHNQPVDEHAEDGLGQRARALIDEVKDLAEHDHDSMD